MKTQTVYKSGTVKVIKRTHVKGPDIGDYHFIVENNGQFVERFGNRSINDAIKLADKVKM